MTTQSNVLTAINRSLEGKQATSNALTALVDLSDFANAFWFGLDKLDGQQGSFVILSWDTPDCELQDLNPSKIIKIKTWPMIEVIH